jgi:hypothetical protein
MVAIEKSKVQSKKIQQILADIKDDAPEKVTKALDSLQVNGNSSIIEPLFAYLRDGKDEKSKALVLEFLCNLKDTPSKLEVIDCLLNTEFEAVRKEIMTVIWNCPIDFSEYIQEFIKIAVAEDFVLTLETLTILEHMEGPFEEKDLFESLLMLKDYHEGKHPKTAEKDVLMSEIALLLRDFENNLLD